MGPKGLAGPKLEGSSFNAQGSGVQGLQILGTVALVVCIFQ